MKRYKSVTEPIFYFCISISSSRVTTVLETYCINLAAIAQNIESFPAKLMNYHRSKLLSCGTFTHGHSECMLTISYAFRRATPLRLIQLFPVIEALVDDCLCTEYFSPALAMTAADSRSIFVIVWKSSSLTSAIASTKTFKVERLPEQRIGICISRS